MQRYQMRTKEVELDEESQETLLNEVEVEFTEEDNKMLEAEITDEEVKVAESR